VLVHGCFWHGHEECKRAKLPVNNANTWRMKIEKNQARDQRNITELRHHGWDVLIVWECELKEITQVAERLRDFISG